MRGSDTVARYGGDEFVVLAGELDRAQDAGHIAEKIADMVSVPLAVDGATEKVGCSIGISLYPDDAEDAEVLIERADRAMYAARRKAAKRPALRFFQRILSSRAAAQARSTLPPESTTPTRLPFASSFFSSSAQAASTPVGSTTIFMRSQRKNIALQQLVVADGEHVVHVAA